MGVDLYVYDSDSGIWSREELINTARSTLGIMSKPSPTLIFRQALLRPMRDLEWITQCMFGTGLKMKSFLSGEVI